MVAAVPELWGVLNVTPDSFSDGGQFLDPDRALLHARQMVTDGASVVDIGAESTRPGAPRIDSDTEIARLAPVVVPLVEAGMTVSVDTMNADTARAALGWGVAIINDVSGGQADPRMYETVADSECRYVMMHWRGHSDVMDSLAHYDDVTGEVISELAGCVEAAVSAGMSPDRIIVDPGLGFAKNPDHNWQVLRDIEQVVAMGYPVLVGASRKRFLAASLPDGHSPTDRDGVSAALSVALAGRGIAALRVHEPLIHRQALQVWAAVQPESPS